MANIQTRRTRKTHTHTHLLPTQLNWLYQNQHIVRNGIDTFWRSQHKKRREMPCRRYIVCTKVYMTFPLSFWIKLQPTMPLWTQETIFFQQSSLVLFVLTSFCCAVIDYPAFLQFRLSIIKAKSTSNQLSIGKLICHMTKTMAIALKTLQEYGQTGKL